MDDRKLDGDLFSSTNQIFLPSTTRKRFSNQTLCVWVLAYVGKHEEVVFDTETEKYANNAVTGV